MRRKITYLALALLVPLGFVSCSQEEVVPQEQELRIATRSTSDESAAETFTDDFTLELWVDATKHETHSMTYTDGIGWNSVKSSILPANAFAYKGSSVTDISYTNKWNYTVDLQLDQSDATKLADADVMIATGSANAESPLNLNFVHYFAKVTFNVTYNSEFLETNEITAFQVMTADGKTVSAYIGGKTVSAILPSGTYSTDTFLNVAVENGTPLSVKVPATGLTFEAGTHYTFNLKVSKDISVQQ